MRTAHTVPAAPFAHALAALMGLLPACATVSANAPAATATTVESPARDRGTATSMGATIRPDWIDTPARRFPAQRFLTGVGSGIDRTTADNRAKALIAEVFSARVESQSAFSESERVDSAGHSERVQSSRQAIRTTTTRDIDSVTIAESWRDETGLYWSLAVLDRERAASALAAEIQSIDERLSRDVAEGAATDAPPARHEDEALQPNNLSRARHAVRVQAALRKRDQLSRDLAIVAPNAVALAPKVDLIEAGRWAGEALRQLSVTIAAEPQPGSESLISSVSRSIAARGIGVDKSERPADLRVQIAFTLSPPLVQDGWHWARGTVRVDILDARLNQTLQSFEVSGRKSSTDAAEAERRLLKALGDQLTDRTRDALLEALR